MTIIYQPAAKSKTMNRNPLDYLGLYGQAKASDVHADLNRKIGYGTAIGHHGELFQGMIEGKEGRIHRALVSLPCAIFSSNATFEPSATEGITVEPAWKVKALRAVGLTLGFCGQANRGGHLKIKSNIQVGWGLGSSTSDVTAAIRATSDAFGRKLKPSEIALLAVEAEIASDSIMFSENAVVFGHREGIVIEDLGGPLPPLEVAGFNTDPTGVGINTLGYAPALYSWWEVQAFKPLIGLLRRAVRTQDARLVGDVAMASADINQKFLPKPHLEDLKALARKAGAVGLQVAHSGTTVGLLFDSKASELPRQIRLAQNLVAEMGFGKTWRFQTNGKRPENGERNEST